MSRNWEKVNQDEYWPCACVKRNKHGMLVKIRLNFRTLEECDVCGCKRPADKQAKWEAKYKEEQR